MPSTGEYVIRVWSRLPLRAMLNYAGEAGIYKVVASRFRKNNGINAFNYLCAYWFILIFHLAILITLLMIEIFWNYIPPGS